MARSPPPRILVVLGATATGKSALALALAERLGGEIVNADALQVYRGFDIGTAKPSGEERRRVRHHLIDILDPEERYSAGEFSRRATAAIEGIAGRGKLPIVVGGSGLYLRALTEGLSPVPAGDPETRRAVRRELLWRLQEEGLAALSAELSERDPETARRLAPGDTQRVLRALEVERVSGRPLSAWIAEQPFGVVRVPAIKIGLTMPRPILYDSISNRAVRMLERGWVEEVEELLQRGITPTVAAFQAIGYRQLATHVLGDRSLEDAMMETVRETRRFAKRQQTWFRKERDVYWIEARGLESRLEDASGFVAREDLRRSDG